MEASSCGVKIKLLLPYSCHRKRRRQRRRRGGGGGGGRPGVLEPDEGPRRVGGQDEPRDKADGAGEGRPQRQFGRPQQQSEVEPGGDNPEDEAETGGRRRLHRHQPRLLPRPAPREGACSIDHTISPHISFIV